MTDDRNYPRTLYREAEHGQHFESAPGAGDGVNCEMRTVDDEDGEKAAKAEGFHNSPAEAAKPKASKSTPKPDAQPSELSLARAEYKKLTGKNPSPRATAEQLREKIAELQKAD